MKNKVKKEPTKKQMEFIAKNVLKNCGYFTSLTKKPDFMARVKKLKEKYELPMTPDGCSNRCKRVCSALVLFRFKKLPELILRISEDLPSDLQTESDFDMARVHAVLRLLDEDQIKEYGPTKKTGLPAFLVPPVTGWAEMPPSQLVVSGLKFFMENLNHISLSFRGKQPLSEEVASLPERLRRGERPKKESGAFEKEIARISPTQSDLFMALELHVCSSAVHSLFLEDIRGLINQFDLGPQWLWTLYVFLVTDVNPIHIGCIPFLNVGISDANSKDKFRLDIGKMTTSPDIQLALSMMQKVGLKSSIRNYPYKNLEENLKIEELSKKKPGVRQEIRDKVKEKKEERRKQGYVFDEDDYQEILDEVKGAANDKVLGERVFSGRVNATDEQLADVIRHRLFRLRKRDKKSFRPSSDSKPGK